MNPRFQKIWHHIAVALLVSHYFDYHRHVLRLCWPFSNELLEVTPVSTGICL